MYADTVDGRYPYHLRTRTNTALEMTLKLCSTVPPTDAYWWRVQIVVEIVATMTALGQR